MRYSLTESFDLPQTETEHLCGLASSESLLVNLAQQNLRLSLHPGGLAPQIVNGAQWREYVLERRQAQIRHSGDATLERLHVELRAYPSPPRAEPSTASPLRDVAVPLLLEPNFSPLSTEEQYLFRRLYAGAITFPTQPLANA